jgi:hypothetical protein
MVHGEWIFGDVCSFYAFHRFCSVGENERFYENDFEDCRS